MSVCPFVRPHGTARILLDGFLWNMILGYFSKTVEKIQDSLKSDKNNGHFSRRPIYFYNHISLDSS